ncbi:MAG: hypothetical protein ACOC71_02725 [Hyphomicrobiales bacterium]
MRSVIYTTAAVAGAMMLHAGTADAGVRNFFSPQVDNARLAFCLQSSDACGKPVADAWCQVNGFDEAVLFQRQEIPNDVLATMYPDTGARCDAETCTSFHQIKCRSSES